MRTARRQKIGCLAASLAVLLVVGAACHAGEYSRLDYGWERQGKQYSPNAPRLFVEGEAFVSFLKFSASSAWEGDDWSTVEIGFSDKARKNQTKIGGGLAIGGDLAPLGIPLKLGLSYRYMGQARFSDNSAALSNGNPVWFAAEGRRTGKAHLHTFSAFGQYDFAGPTSRFKPFLTARLGTTLVDAEGRVQMRFSDDMGYWHTTYDSGRESFSKWAFTYGIGAGIGYDLTNNLRADMAYEYVATSKVRLSDLSGKVKASGHIIKVGLGWTF